MWDASLPGNDKTFTMRAYICAVAGDRPAVEKMMQTVGPNGRLPCQFCTFAGTWVERSNHNYYPHSSCRNMPRDPATWENRDWNIDDLPYRRHLRRDMIDVARANDDKLRTGTGISGFSILHRLPTISWPWSFGLDVMHLICDNLCHLLFNLWDGRLPQAAAGTSHPVSDGEADGRGEDDGATPMATPAATAAPGTRSKPKPKPKRTSKKRAADPWVMPKKVLEELGLDMRNCRRQIPGALGRAPRNIQKNSAGFKATEWSLWMSLFSVPLLEGRLPERYLANWETLCEAYVRSIEFEITMDDLAKIRLLFKRFVRDYESLYYQKDHRRMQVCPSSIHMLLHLADCIEQLGPAWVFWAFPMARMCGMVVPKARSKSELNASLANTVFIGENLKQFEFVRLVSKDFNAFLKPPDSSRAFIIKVPEGWFVSPETELTLSTMPRRLLVQMLETLVGSRVDPQALPKEVKAYKRFQLSQGRDMVGSQASQKRSDRTRASNIILYIQETHGRHEVFFGEVLIFARPCYERQHYPLAYVKCYGPAQLRRGRFYIADSKPTGGLHEWIHVAAIERLVGTMSTKWLSSQKGFGRKPVWIIDRQSFGWNSAARLINSLDLHLDDYA
ncbi:hypothetical protein G7K_6266-t1 [Saitoella complicata NRRL Y-17804]|uniref:DUF4218 domain-containing protein n=2 Tax=Saitoella complicata (strain BCRC 22490 / CBS 7301 / JCM 7358 / NBRC 10748 / NRRL Y-17804) TaxID=698492 RepID=A0A0E9NQW2_SAICN|nr:hypothetical protein G7K_6266-t1 [Saitoella complicata NRRL Y-17804]